MKVSLVAIACVAVLFLAPAARAQEEHQHSHGGAEDFGIVNFPTSCRADVASEFTRAVALLHSFGYEESRRSFEIVAKEEPGCAMAYWGIAMTYYHPIWAPPNAEELAAGKAAAAKAMEIGGQTERERWYIAAVRAFYQDSETVPHGPRARAYVKAIEALSRRFPDDHEATIFYALSLLGTAPASDLTFSNQKKAAGILNGLLPVEPRHPGITHYMIHAFDYPLLANEALPAARAYAKIAPSSPHALHMPSHIFTRLGLWPESIASNIDSADAGRKLVAKRHPGASSFDALHALDYLEYAYLQVGDQDSARKVLEETATAKTFDEPQFQAGYAVAAVPARWTLERRDWKGAAALELPGAHLPWERFPYAPSVTYFARALGAARTDQLDRARAALAKLQEIQTGLAKSPVPGPYDWAANVEATRLASGAWLAYAEGKKDEALKMARAAADLEDRTGKHPVTPGAVLPARELLGDMLLDSGRPAEALVEYEASLREAPGRFNSLYGAARAAELAKKPERARELYGKLVGQCVSGSSRPELTEARRFLEGARVAALHHGRTGE
jgi:tetratricopeptide (TPR) repeat protein